MVFTFGSATTVTNSFLSMFYIASFVKSVTASLKNGNNFDTWAELWAVIFWSFQALWHGRHPDTDWRGQPFEATSRFAAKAGRAIAGGLRFCIFHIMGDLEFMANTLGLPHWRNHDMCFECNATQSDGPRPWQVCWHAKQWSRYDPREFSYQSRHDHVIFQLPGVTSWCCCFDMLHLCDTKGTICPKNKKTYVHITKILSQAYPHTCAEV
jgi:hypothetical protein